MSGAVYATCGVGCPIPCDGRCRLGTSEESAQDVAPSYVDRLRAALVDTAGLDDIADPDPLIGPDIVFRDSLVWVVGKTGHGKTFVTLDWAGCVATGTPWQGHVATDPGPVLYLVAEGVRGIKQRVRAWEAATGCPMAGVHFLPVAVQARNSEQWAALIRLATEVRPILVVLDTQARVTVGVEENSNAEMGLFVERLDQLRRATGACVVVVHHIGRNGDTGRGATTVDGALETIVKVTKDGERLKLECTKNKDAPEWDDIALRMVPYGDSAVLAVDDGTRTAADGKRPKWLEDWWRLHEAEPVSVSVLVKSGVVTESTFHRCKLELLKYGLIADEGTGNSRRYRLTADPAPG